MTLGLKLRSQSLARRDAHRPARATSGDAGVDIGSRSVGALRDDRTGPSEGKTVWHAIMPSGDMGLYSGDSIRRSASFHPSPGAGPSP